MFSTTPRFYSRVFAVACAAILGLLLWRTLASFLAPMAWAALLAFLAQPLEKRLSRRLKKPTLTAGILTGCAALLVLIPLLVFSLAFVQQASELIRKVQAESISRKLSAVSLFIELPWVSRALGAVEQFTALSRDQVFEQVSEAVQSALRDVASVGGTLVLGVVTVATQSLLTLFFFFFFVRDGREMIALGIRLVPMEPQRKESLVSHLGGVARAVVFGTTVTALVQGALVGIGFAIAGVPSPLVFGALASVAALVPIVGTGLVWVPAVLILLAEGARGWAIFLGVWCVLLVGGADNVLRPWIISGQSKISTLLIIIGVLGGVPAFGVAGLFVGPLLLTLISALLKFADETQSVVQTPNAPPIQLP
jgi:predicted PurR-regulated permease PerM